MEWFAASRIDEGSHLFGTPFRYIAPDGGSKDLATACHDESTGGGFPATLRAAQLYGQLAAPLRGAISRSVPRRETGYGKDSPHVDAVENFVEERLSTWVTNIITGGHRAATVGAGPPPRGGRTPPRSTCTAGEHRRAHCCANRGERDGLSPAIRPQWQTLQVAPRPYLQTSPYGLTPWRK